MKKGKWKRIGVFLSLAAALFFGGATLEAEAGTLYESSYVTFSPTGGAWTIKEALPAGFNPQGSAREALNAGVYFPVSSGFTTGTESRLEELQTGQHYHKYVRQEEVPVGEWKVAHMAATCVHGLPKYPDSFQGISFGTALCGGRYYSGWVPYCADCGEAITEGYLVYGSSAAIHTINSIDTRLKLYYTCPTCNHLEQGTDYKHECKRPSYNRYQVQYDANISSYNEVAGYVMDPSFHMYNNATEYEGSPVVPQKTLNLNEYERIGYTFMEWNTRPDGGGTSYGDGAEILNLTTENYDAKTGKGIVVLYAQWRRSESILKIDPNGGTYDGKEEPAVIKADYGSVYEIDRNKLVPPKGFRVSFDTRGGNSISPMDTACEFVSWEKSSSFLGRMKESKYAFTAPDGNVDTVTAAYVQGSIILPTPTKPGSSFGGWFEDIEGKKPVGMGGDIYTPRGDITLYAKWVDLVLYSVTDLSVDDGRGGVDLTWVQSDTLNKTYKIYQSLDSEAFYQISAATQNAAEAADLDMCFNTEGTKSYTVKSSGYYQIEADGASGKDFGSYKGGKGGKVSATFYLSKGDVLSITVGRQGGGGSGSSQGGAGGGMTIVESEKKGILLIAGGGGGALKCANGENGGAINSMVSSATAGKAGTAGGGSGATGGAAGSYIPSHTHSEAAGCYHHHTGSAASGGGCYTAPAQVVCGTYQSDGVTYAGWWRYDNDTAKGCQQCNRPLAGHGRTHPTYHYKCDGCGAAITGQNNGGKTHYKSGWALGCGKTEGQLVCAKSTAPGTITPARGGSSYISAERLSIINTTKGGAAKGNGSVGITAKAVGYSDACRLDDVSANDKAAPEKISAYEKEGVGGDRVLVTWAMPEDKGTVYYHKVESYDSTTNQYIITGNITRNLITTGVAGYYYIVDTKPATKVSLGSAQNKNALLSQDRDSNTCGLMVLMSEQTRYLHLVAVDVAGNLNPEKTVHIRLDYDDASIDWPIMTKQIQVSSTLGTKNYGSVYASPTEDKTFYVKADGATPFLLSFASYMDMEEKARDNYMIDYQIFDVRTGETKQQFTAKLPYSPVLSGTVSSDVISLDAAKFVRRISGTSILKDAMYIGASRGAANNDTLFYQAFTVENSYNGQRIAVMPSAGMSNGSNGEIRYSDRADDSTHAVTLIPDGEGPIIGGTEGLEGLSLIKQNGNRIELSLTASDNLSGVDIFYVEIENLDSVYSVKYIPDEEGNIHLKLSDREAVLNGDFVIRIYAVDHVGNETIQEYSATEFALQVEISRILEPHTPIFQCGESGILTIHTYGYAERVEVEFPAEMTALNPQLNQVFDYSGETEYKKEESVQFMIPLNTPVQENYCITVRAYKGDKKLEQYPTLGTISVSGTILNELRTRLR